jgi:3',5'-cyclic-AMP phosphodiesterase
MKIIHLTDTHLVSPGQKLYGLDPRARLDAAVLDINRAHGDATVAVVTGDLTHWGEDAAYVAFRASMAELTVPYVVLLGNHDKRNACRAILSAAPIDADGHIQGTRDTTQGRFVFLDTLDETSHAGQLCAKRIGWLKSTLAQSPIDQPFYIFMHHPPFAVGIHAMDDIALMQRADFVDAIGPYQSRIRHIFFGHVHRPISGSWRGIPFSTLRGTNHQVAFDLDPKGQHLASHEPPAYGVVLMTDDGVVVHTHDYLDASPRFPFAAPRGDDRSYVLGPITA